MTDQSPFKTLADAEKARAKRFAQGVESKIDAEYNALMAKWGVWVGFAIGLAIGILLRTYL